MPTVLRWALVLAAERKNHDRSSRHLCSTQCHSGASIPKGAQIAIPYSPYSSILGLMVRSSIIWRLIWRGRM